MKHADDLDSAQKNNLNDLNDKMEFTAHSNAVKNSSKIFCMQWKSLVGSDEKKQDGNLAKFFIMLSNLRMTLSHYSLVVSKMLHISKIISVKKSKSSDQL